MVKSLYSTRTLDDEIAKDALSAISKLERSSLSRNCYALTGGFGVQSYLPTSCRRPSEDIDLIIGVPLDFKSFALFIKPVKEHLIDEGYKVKSKLVKFGYNLFVVDDDKSEGMVIEFLRINQNSFNNMRHILERELRNCKRKTVEGKSDVFSVLSPEDLIAPKLLRVMGTLKKYPDLVTDLAYFRNLGGDRGLKEKLTYVKNLRDLDKPNSFFREKMKFFSDVFDIRILYEVAGFNMDYLKKAIGDWNLYGTKSTEFMTVTSNILPGLFY